MPAKKSAALSPSALIAARIAELGDWRGETLAKVRAIIHAAIPDVEETWKWRGVPVWEKDGILCTGETYKAVVKLTFAKGARVADPAGLFNSSLDGNARRAIDIREGEKINEKALKALVKAAAALNAAKPARAAKAAAKKSAVKKAVVTAPAKQHRIYGMSVASVYPMYVAKVEKKGRTKAELDQAIRWLTGHSQKGLDAELAKKTDFETFFAKAPKLNPARSQITGVICGVRIEEIVEPTMREIRYLDKLVDELAKGRPMEKVLRR